MGNEYILPSMKEQVESLLCSKRIDVICGGNSRQESVYLGLKQSLLHTPAPTHALIHDAARPLITKNEIDAMAKEVIASGAATMASVVPDTVKRVDKETLYIKETLIRDELYLAQTPQGGRIDWLLEAHQRLASINVSVTDDAACLEHAGHSVKVVPGSRFNIKVTHSEDMDFCRYILSHRSIESFGFLKGCKRQALGFFPLPTLHSLFNGSDQDIPWTGGNLWSFSPLHRIGHKLPLTSLLRPF